MMNYRYLNAMHTFTLAAILARCFHFKLTFSAHKWLRFVSAADTFGRLKPEFSSPCIFIIKIVHKVHTCNTQLKNKS